MRVFMLGWEFPPSISGGLGTACYGLTKALSRRDVGVIFVLPHAIDPNHSSHVRLLSPSNLYRDDASAGNGNGNGNGGGHQLTDELATRVAGLYKDRPEFANVTFRSVPSRIVSPYPSGIGEEFDAPASAEELARTRRLGAIVPDVPTGHYHGDLLADATRYAGLCVDLARSEQFDVIHAHDWLTYPAGMAVAAVTGKPLVVHVHATEFDRSGENVFQPVYDIERRGMHGAMRVICVSYLTRSIIEHRYGVDPEKIDVVYNGVENDGANGQPRTGIARGDKIVLFLGRITMQKGPEYFIGAAKKVLEKYQNVKFVMAGSGDKIGDIIQMAAAAGIGQKVLFTGFLRGKDVQRVFEMADVYVMPSVSEPFGIAPLEAIRHDVPVIISKTSGVAEVLTHALKVDFWDTHDIANKIIAVLRHPPLSNTLREHADFESRRLTWDDAARKCEEVYEHTQQVMSV